MIYFIQSGNRGSIKIGYTDKNVSQRMSDLQCGSAEQLYLLGTIPGDISGEKDLHNKFKEHHVRGEWFEPSQQLYAFIIENSTNDIESVDYKIDYGFNLDHLLSVIEEKYIKKALMVSEGNKSKGSELLGMSFRQFRYRCSKYNL